MKKTWKIAAALVLSAALLPGTAASAAKCVPHGSYADHGSCAGVCVSSAAGFVHGCHGGWAFCADTRTEEPGDSICSSWESGRGSHCFPDADCDGTRGYCANGWRAAARNGQGTGRNGHCGGRGHHC